MHGAVMSLDLVVDVVHIERGLCHICRGVKGLEFAVIRRKLVPTPALITELAPVVDAGLAGVHETKDIDGARAAYRLAARVGNDLSIEMFLEYCQYVGTFL